MGNPDVTPDTGTVTAFEDVTVVPMDTERRLAHHTVLVDGTRVRSVTPTAEISVPHGVRRIDGRGKYIMPGLSDMHCHLMSERHLFLYIAHGVTTVRNLHGLPRHLAWRQETASGHVLGPAIYTAGPIVAGPPTRRLWATAVTTRADAFQAVADIKRNGYDAVKVYDDLSRDAYQGVIDAAAAFNLPVWGHIPWTVRFHEVLDAGQRSIEHQYGFLEALLPPGEAPISMVASRATVSRHASSLAEADFSVLANAVRASGSWSCPTAVLDKRRTQDIQDIIEGPGARYLPSGTADTLRRANQLMPAEYSARLVWPLYLKAIKALHDAGVGLLTGTDTPMPGVLPGVSLHDELQIFTEAGLTPYQALRASTSDPARFMCAEGVWGVVRQGARADLLLLDADPLDDVTNAAKIAGVMVAGRWHSGEDLQRGLDRIASEIAADQRKPHRKPALPAREGILSPTAETRRYETEQGGFTVAVEEVSIIAQAGGGRMLHSRASMQGASMQLDFIGDASDTYESEVHTDANGVDQIAVFDYEGIEGREHLVLTRTGLDVRIERRDSWSGDHSNIIGASGQALLSRPQAALWVQVSRSIEDLAVGATRTLDILGPGLPAAVNVYPSLLHVERITDSDAANQMHRQYKLELRRPNFGVDGILFVDRDGWPTEVHLTGTRTGVLEAMTQRLRRVH